MNTSNLRMAARDSGIPGLGGIPAHWRVMALKHLVDIPITDGPHETPDFVDSGVPFVSAEAVWGGRVHVEDMRGFISRDAHDVYSKKYKPAKNDIFVVKSGATTGKVAIVDINDEFGVWSPLAAIRCDQRQALPQFVFYSLVSDYFQGQVQTSWSLGTQPNIGMEVLENLHVLLPPLPDQCAIAKYLDRETARLDALVAAKERVLGLLTEKRRALITRAVTRGLDPSAPLRESGIPWLGKIPAHWATTQLKFASVSLQTGPFGSQLHAEDYVTGGTPVVNPSHLNAGRIHAEDRVSVDEGTAESLAVHRLRRGDIVFARRGEMGRCGVVEAGNVGWLCGTGSLRARLRTDKANPYYLALVFTETRISDVLTFQAVGSTMFNLSTEILGSCHLPIPPLAEQRAIVTHVVRMMADLDTLRAVTERTIALLVERRGALIAAAVTGQIDVGSGEYTDDAVRQKEPERRQ